MCIYLFVDELAVYSSFRQNAALRIPSRYHPLCLSVLFFAFSSSSSSADVIHALSLSLHRPSFKPTKANEPNKISSLLACAIHDDHLSRSRTSKSEKETNFAFFVVVCLLVVCVMLLAIYIYIHIRIDISFCMVVVYIHSFSSCVSDFSLSISLPDSFSLSLDAAIEDREKETNVDTRSLALSLFFSFCQKHKYSVVVNEKFHMYVCIYMSLSLDFEGKKKKQIVGDDGITNGFCAMYRIKQTTLVVCVYLYLLWPYCADLFFMWHFLFLVCFFRLRSLKINYTNKENTFDEKKTPVVRFLHHFLN